MLRILCFFLLFSVLQRPTAYGVICTKGIGGIPTEATFQWTLVKKIDSYLPFNPVIVAVNSLTEVEATWLANYYPLGRLTVCESDRSTCDQFASNVSAARLDFDTRSFDQYCFSQNISQIDLLRINDGKASLELLKTAQEILKNTSVISVKTDFSLLKNKRNFDAINYFLICADFIFLYQWYEEKSQGEAIFIRKEMFNAIYK